MCMCVCVLTSRRHFQMKQFSIAKRTKYSIHTRKDSKKAERQAHAAINKYLRTKNKQIEIKIKSVNMGRYEHGIDRESTRFFYANQPI